MSVAAEVQITRDDYDELIASLKEWSDSFNRWDKAGTPSPKDIDCIHVPNVINSLDRKVKYQQVRDKLMSKYDIDEKELIAQALTLFAATRR
jgi:hypothetical protein